MASTRQRKNHKKKLKARRDRIDQAKNRAKKLQREFIMNLINKEKEEGKFDNNPVIAPILSDSQDVIEGPSI